MTKPHVLFCLMFLAASCSSSGGSPGGKGGSGGGGGDGGSGGGGGGGGAGGGGAGGGGAGGAGGSGGSAPDASADNRPPDTGTPGDGGGTPGAVKCGTTPMAFDVTKIGRVEGLAIGPDGTVYFSSFGTTVGRYRPPYDMDPNKAWATIPGAMVFGLILDPKKNVVYAGARGVNALYQITIEDTPKVTKIADANSINGVTLGEDGAVYYTEQGGGHVFRVVPGEMKTQVTKMPVSQANGLAFAPPPDGRLYVLSWQNPGVVTRIKLENNMEMSREEYVQVPKGNADGLAFDTVGNLYVSSGALFKVTPAKVVSMVAASASANMDFGAGALSCKDLIYSAGQEVLKLTTDTDGIPVPWHRE